MGLGAAIPGLIAAFGSSRIYFQQATLFGLRGRPMLLSGTSAIAFGIEMLAAALFMHAHYFLSNSERLGVYAGLAKVIALLTGIICIVFIVMKN